MQDDFRDRQRNNLANMRMVKDITMALIILGVAVLLFFAPQLGLRLKMGDGYRIALGSLFAIYGLFRLYRGIKKDY